jgi:ubiquinone/menaquinone biosynthesis C-methylase UbiE
MRRGWNNVELAQADATRFQSAEQAVDVVTFSFLGRRAVASEAGGQA